MLLIEKILAQVANNAMMQKVRRFVDDNNVLQTRFSDGFFMARVKDEQNRIFTVHANLKDWKPSLAKCMCGQEMPCIHLLAGLQSWLNVHQKGSAKSLSPFKSVSWVTSDETLADTAWNVDLSGDAQDGFEYQLSIEQEQQQLNLVDLLVYLLDTYAYHELMAKADDSII